MYRTVDTGIWEDPWFAKRPASAKLLFLYLLTNRRSAKRYELSPRIAAFETGLTVAEIVAAAPMLAPEAIWDLEQGLVTLTNRGRWIGDGLRPPAREWAALRTAAFERDGYTCQYCGAQGVRLHADHIRPISRGGTNDLDNLATACVPCNRHKHARTPEEWRA